jgi:hypothetical protein
MLSGRGELTGRVVGALWWDRERGADQIEELLDLVGPAFAVPPQRADDAPRQLAPPGQRRVRGLAAVGLDDGVLPVGDAETMELGLREA